MVRKVLLNPKKEIEDPIQQTRLFRTACKTKDKVCKMIIDSGSIDNLVSIDGEAGSRDNCTPKSI